MLCCRVASSAIHSLLLCLSTPRHELSFVWASDWVPFTLPLQLQQQIT
uniref:Uncharacterized protein n=1 Tax=Arundo donax TaxID=35708 RepID=A0A0A8ZH65_ARUDO